MTKKIGCIQEGSGPLYKRLADLIERKIFSGHLQPGDKLPTHRELADELQVNVTTVTRGYREAEKRGLINGTVGRGTFVSSDAATCSTMMNPEPYAPGMIEMGLVNPLYQFEPDLNSSLQQIGRTKDLSIFLKYSEPGGSPAHRKAGADWVRRFGLEVRQDDILVCSGAQHCLTCILISIFQAGDRIATDCVTYPGMKALAAMLGLRLVPVEMDGNGMVPDSLDRICRREKVSGLYLMPGVQNPTTMTIPDFRREQLAKVAATHNLRVIEDDAYDLTRSGVIEPLTVRLPEKGFYIGGMSKAFAAGLRVAFLVVPQKFRRIVQEAILNTIWMTPALNVELVSQWIRQGRADEIIAAKRKEANVRYRMASEILGDFAICGQPTGFYLWLTLPEPWKGLRFEQRMRELGVNVFGAEKFTVGNYPPPAAVRISLTGPTDQRELKRGLILIREVLSGERETEFTITR